MCKRLLRLKHVLTIMTLEGDLRVSLTDAQWAIVKDETILLKPFMIAQKLLEGESYVTVSLIPFMLYKNRSSLEQANSNPSSSHQVVSVFAVMLQKFEEEFGSGVEHTITTDHLLEGNHWQSVGIPKIVLIAMCLDPRTKSAIGIPNADRELIWQYLENDLIDLTFAMGPPIAGTVPIAEAPVGVPCNNRNGVAARYTQDVNDFLEDLNNVDDNLEELDDDYLRELNDVNNPMNMKNGAGGGLVNWTHDVAATLVRSELDIYQAVSGIKMRDSVTGKFKCPLEWWRLHQNDFVYLSCLAAKYLSIPVTSAPYERVFSTAGLTIAKDRAQLDSDRANELVFLHDGLPAITKYEEAIKKA
jgi:hypothetical protein